MVFETILIHYLLSLMYKLTNLCKEIIVLSEHYGVWYSFNGVPLWVSQLKHNKILLQFIKL